MSHYNNNYHHPNNSIGNATDRPSGNPYASTNRGTVSSSSLGMNYSAFQQQQETGTTAQQPMDTDTSAEVVTDLKDQLQALRRELMAQSESNFELNATIATMQAEMTHTIKTSEAKHKEEASKLSHLLRLEQQKSQRLEQQQHKQHQQMQFQQQQQQQQQERERENVELPQRKKAASSAQQYAKRLAVGVPQSITTTNATSNRSPTPTNADTNSSPSPKDSRTLVTPKSVATNNNTNKTPNHTTSRAGGPYSNGGASRLAQHLLQEITTTATTTTMKTNNNDMIRQVLVDIASDDRSWTQVKLLEFLIRHSSMELWYPTLLMSQPARGGIIQAVESTVLESNIINNNNNNRKSSKKSRITVIGKSNINGTSITQSQTEAGILQALQDPWWTPSSTTFDSSTTISDPTSTTMIPSTLAVGWVSSLPDSLVYQKLQALNVLLEECNNSKGTIWWNLLHTKMEVVMEQIHRIWIQPLLPPPPAQESKAGNHPKTPSQRQQRRRLDVSFEKSSNDENNPVDASSSRQLMATSLSIWGHLLQVTQIEALDVWYKEGKGPKMVSLVLDLLEEHATTSNQNAKRVDGWYCDAIHFLTMIGSTRRGFDILRTRSRPAGVDSGDYWMDSTLDLAIRQMFSLVSDQEEEEEEGSDGKLTAASLRAVAIDCWVRLFHQVLMFVQQQQQQLDKQPVALSFRSLVLEYQNWYTSACAMLLANAKTRPELQSMIRIQLEELSMDEEEYEELKE